KRAYEMLEVVIHYKAREMALLHLIDEFVTKIAYAVSEHVKIETVNPFFLSSYSGCTSGGSCICSL
ncbi:YlbF family regulator, partial [Staphylococcus aureus]|nr:YlbF family regulator [Staphylococcus aureus]